MLKNMLLSHYATRSPGTEIINYLHCDDPFLWQYQFFIDEYSYIIDRHRNLQEVINHIVFDVYPEIPYYQIITDDAIYHTPKWDTMLISEFEKRSNGWGFACGNDGANNGDWYQYEHPSMEIWSWKQAKLLGYVWPRYFNHQGIDFFTKDLAKSIRGLVFVPEVSIEHLYWGGCKKKQDDNIKEAYSGKAYSEAFAAYRKWIKEDKGTAVKKITEARENEG